MEMLFDALFQAFGDVAFDGLNVLDGTTPNSNHEALASLAVAGYLPKCITLNFDVLIETAILIKKGTYSTYCPLADKMLGEEVISSSDILIVKPHGSFAKPGQYSDRLQYVAATLSQCGRLPMIANINAIGGLIRKSNVLLVAGYSDNDWDIFPVLRDHSGTLERVIWIAHADVKKLHQPQNPEQIVNILGDKQKVKVLEFIAAFGQRASILIGDLRDVLSKLQREMDVNVPNKLSWKVIWSKQQGEQEGTVNDSKHFWKALKSDRPRLALSLAAILGARVERVFLQALLKWITSHAAPSDYKLIGDCYWRYGGSLFMADELRKSITVNKEATRILLMAPDPNYAELADHYLWLGYQYLSFARPPRVARIPEALRMPYNLVIGLCYLRRAVHIERRHSQDQLIQGKAACYCVDFLHYWANAFLLLGPKGRLLSKYVHRMIAHLYQRLFNKHPRQRDIELYRMRDMEAMVLGGARVETLQEFMHELNIIEESCNLTLNEHHLGNVFVYKALLYYEAGDIGEATRLMAEAEAHWSSEAYKSKSGLRRVALFRRFLSLNRS